MFRTLPLVLSLFALTARAADRPNVLWITAEDMSPQLGCYGDPVAKTPRLDAFAREAVKYTRAFASAPVCAPSRACLITGMYATSLGNPHLRCQVPLPPNVRGYAAYLREAGYFTTNNVKTDYNVANLAGFVRDTWDRNDPKAHWRQRAPGQPFMAVFNLMESHQGWSNCRPWAEFESHVGAALSMSQRTDPADVQLPAFYPDTPLARRTMARNYDCIAYVDMRVGQILQELEKDGLAEETIVFFYSDHGMGLPRGKRVLHDSGMRVPLLIRFPKKWQHLAPAKPGESTDRLVSFVDFAPTLLALCGVPVPAHMQGAQFAGANAASPRELVFGARDRVDEVTDVSRSVRGDRWLYIRNYMPHLSWMQPEASTQQGEFRRELVTLAAAGKLNAAQRSFAAPQRPREELYDTAADPEQVRNLAAEPEHAAVLAKMRGELRKWILDTRDLGFLPEQLVLERAKGDAPRTMAQDAARYPLERILNAAELVGDFSAVQKQHALLRDDDPGVRYWAAVGIRAAVANVMESSPPKRVHAIAHISEAAHEALRDSSLTVRIEAAGAVLALEEDKDGEAMEILTTALRSGPPDARLHAARTLELLGERARPALAVLREVWPTVQDGRVGNNHALFLRFSIGAALRTLGEPISWDVL